MKTIPLDKIICESNRKYTKDTGFEQLLNSIKQYGIIEPPIVRRMNSAGLLAELPEEDQKKFYETHEVMI